MNTSSKLSVGTWPLLVVLVLFAATGTRLATAQVQPAKAPSAQTLYTQECGSCHMAYPPQLLPAASWRRVMAGLDKHYGSDAAVDASTAKTLDAWLQANGGQDKRARQDPPQDRMTRSDWFAREHREISAATFKRPSIKSASNCTACHTGAAQGDFDEHRVRIPK